MRSSAFTPQTPSTRFASLVHLTPPIFQRATSLCRYSLPLRRKLRRSHLTRARLPKLSARSLASLIHDMRCTSLMRKSRANCFATASFRCLESGGCGALRRGCSASLLLDSRRRNARPARRGGLRAAAARAWRRRDRRVEATRQRTLLSKATNHEAVVLIDRSADAIPREEF